MNERRYAILVEEKGGSDFLIEAEALAEVKNLSPYEANKLARESMGIIDENLDEATVSMLVNALRLKGVSSFIVPMWEDVYVKYAGQTKEE